MASELSIPTIVKIGKLSQVLSNVDIQKNILMKGQALDQRLPRTIYEVWKPLSIRLQASPSDPTLRQMGEWLMQLCGPYGLQSQTILNNLSGSLPVITGPSNQSGLVGFTATFSVSVAGAGPFTYQWFRNSALVPGATANTLNVPNAQLTDNGSTFFVLVTNAAGTQVSGTATLTVTQSIVGFYYFGTDFSLDLLSGNDDVPYAGTFPITDGNPLSITFPSGAENTFLVIKYPNTQTAKISYLNLPLNTGVIPSIAFDHTNITTWRYVFSRTGNPFGLNSANPLVLS
jgi:hypothetical protein